VIRPDTLRPPAPSDPTAEAYKDWLHLNVFDHVSGAVGLVNVSLSGAPDDPRSRAVGTALLHVSAHGWAGNLEAQGFDDAQIGQSAIALERVAVAVDHASGTVTASAHFPDDGFALEARANSLVPALAVEEPLPLGPGWFSWYAVGRLAVAGEARVDGQVLPLSGASAYHDHNWGRWHWGDDLGWDWGAFLAPDPGPAVILIRLTDRHRKATLPPALVVHVEGGRRTFSGPGVALEEHGRLAPPARGVPGSLASLHADRGDPGLPSLVRVTANDGVDWIEIEFRAHAAAQLVTAEPMRRGYGFIHELAGEFRCEGQVAGVALASDGLGVVERAA
jgi:hypothetical protein